MDDWRATRPPKMVRCLFKDDRNGVICYVAAGSRSQPRAVSGASMLHQARTGAKSDLAFHLTGAQTTATLSVSSNAFSQNGSIPIAYSSYDQNASTPLRWTRGPQGTQSYAILAEDPDAMATPLPVVHWVVWNTSSRRPNCGKVWTGWKIPWDYDKV
jgi:hypothetical protein